MTATSASAPLQLGDFDYHLPAELIAQQALTERSASRLLQLGQAHLSDGSIRDLAHLLNPGDLLVMNDSKVLHARLLGHKESGGQVEVMVERICGEHEVLAQIRASKPPRPGSRLHLENQLDVVVIERLDEFYRLRFPASTQVIELLERHGRLPLPPYIERAAGTVDETRYQTVYAREQGSVAAPTAGLHFDAALLAALAQRGINTAYVTLHVGAGTFQPVRCENLSEHQMHRECYTLPAATIEAMEHTRAAGGRIVAVGTTTLRTLESAAIAGHGQLRSGQGETNLFILPGFRFQVVDLLLTNFHLPKSTLLMLVSAFAGTERIRQAYQHAIKERYRFFSYGDAMLLTRAELLP